MACLEAGVSYNILICSLQLCESRNECLGHISEQPPPGQCIDISTQFTSALFMWGTHLPPYFPKRPSASGLCSFGASVASAALTNRALCCALLNLGAIKGRAGTSPLADDVEAEHRFTHCL